MKQLGIILIILLFVACQTVALDPDEVVVSDPRSIQIENNFDRELLNQRIDRSRILLQPIVESKNKLQNRNDADNLSILASVENPVVSGVELSATSVAYDDQNDIVYVGYHANGNPILGAIDVYDVSDTSNPSLIAQHTFNNLEFVDLDIYFKNGSGFLYTAGTTDLDTDSWYSVFHCFDIDSNGQLSTSEGGFVSKYVEFGTSSSILKYSDYVYLATAGSNGKVIPAKKDFSKFYTDDQWTSPGGSLKYIHDYKGELIILTNGEFYHTDIKAHNKNFASNISWSKTFDAITPSDGKNVVSVNQNNIYLSAGDNGLLVYTYDENEAELSHHYKSETYKNLANAVYFEQNYVYISNGWALSVMKSSDLETVYHYNLGLGSINFATVAKKLIFVAAGTGGLYILER
jgi:hypothetical protein